MSASVATEPTAKQGIPIQTTSAVKKAPDSPFSEAPPDNCYASYDHLMVGNSFLVTVAVSVVLITEMIEEEIGW